MLFFWLGIKIWKDWSTAQEDDPFSCFRSIMTSWQGYHSSWGSILPQFLLQGYGNEQHGDFQPSNIYYEEKTKVVTFIDVWRPSDLKNTGVKMS